MQKPMFNLATLFVGLLMLLLIGACSKVKVSITCQPGGGSAVCEGEDCPPGGCNPGVGWNGGSATGFWIVGSNPLTQVTAGQNLFCSVNGSKKCPGNPGNCGFGKTCKSWYRPLDSFCYCGCP